MKENFEDRYEVLETITGSGTLVYKAIDRSFDRMVAIKTLDDRSLGNPTKLERFIKEGHLLAKFDHPNIITAYNFHEIGEFDERCYLVCPWIETSLDQVLDKENLSSAAACDIFLKILEGVRTLHNHNIIHRDLKPGNIFLSEDRQQVKIADLGIASNVESDQTLDPDALTPKYHAPEVLDETQKIGRRADVYSLGMIFYEMMLGRMRFEQAFPEIYQNQDSASGTNMRWLNWHQDPDRNARPLNELAGEIGESAANIVSRMMHKVTSERYGDIDTIVNDLKEYMGAGVSSLPYAAIENISDEPPLPFHKRRSFKVLAALGVLVWGGLIYFMLFYQSPAELRALEVEAQMNQLRATAITLALDVEGSNVDFPEGEGHRDKGYVAKNASKFQPAANLFSLAKDEYEASVQAELSSKIDGLQTLQRDIEAISSVQPDGFESGVSLLAEGNAHIEALQYDSAIVSLNQSLDSFTKAYAIALLSEDNRLVAELKGRVMAPEMNIYERALKLMASGEKSLVEEQYKESVAELKNARDNLIELIDVSKKPRLAKVGSDEAQINGALSLCRQFNNECQRSWYTSEVYQEILLKPFELDLKEVSNEDFLKFVVATGYVTDAEKIGYSYRVIAGKLAKIKGLTWSSNIEEVDATNISSLPVVNISYQDAKSYCEHYGKRLPSAAEWEFVASGKGARTLFPWGSEWSGVDVVWGNGDYDRPVSVSGASGEYKKTGHHHLIGNVWEWTSTSYEGDVLLKGGSWSEANPANMRAAAATSFAGNESSDDFGFRCAKSTDVW